MKKAIGFNLVLMMFLVCMSTLTFNVLASSTDEVDLEVKSSYMSFNPASPVHLGTSTTVAATIHNEGICYVELGENGDQVNYDFTTSDPLNGYRINPRVRSTNGDTITLHVWMDLVPLPGVLSVSSTTWSTPYHLVSGVWGAGTHTLHFKLLSGADTETKLHVDWIDLLKGDGSFVMRFEAEGYDSGGGSVDAIHPQQVEVKFYRTAPGPQIGTTQTVGENTQTIETGTVKYLSSQSIAQIVWAASPAGAFNIYCNVTADSNEQTKDNNAATMVIHIYTILTISANAAAGGTTNPAIGQHNYEGGNSDPVTATASANWVFSNWLLDGSNAGSANPITIAMAADHALTAVFNPILSWSSDGGGSIDLNPAPGASNDYALNNVVTATADPNGGWVFNHWHLDGGDSGSANPKQVTMDGPHTLIAVFYPILSTSVEGSGSIGLNPVQGSSGEYPTNAVVSATAYAGGGSWYFDHWVLDGNWAGGSNPRSVTMDAPHSLKAVFYYRVVGGVQTGLSLRLLAPIIATALIVFFMAIATTFYRRRVQ